MVEESRNVNKKEKRKTELVGEEKRGWKKRKEERILKVKPKGREEDERQSSEV